MHCALCGEGYVIKMQQKAEGTLQQQSTVIFIGKLIEEELRRQERSVTWLSRKIHCDRRNVYDIFRRSDIDTNLLYRISQVLNTDFFKIYSVLLQSSDYQ